MAFTGQSKNVQILAGIFSLNILYLEGKSPLLMRNIMVNLGPILPETSKSSAFWDMGGNYNLKWLPLFSPDEACESDGTSLTPLMTSPLCCNTSFLRCHPYTILHCSYDVTPSSHYIHYNNSVYNIHISL